MSQQQSPPEPPFWDQYTVFKFMSGFPALTAGIVRRKVGFRTLNDTTLLIMTAIMIIIAHNSESRFLGAYAVIFWLVGKWQAWNRYKEMKAGAKWHTKSGGISFWEYAPLPRWLRSEDRIYRFIEPMGAFAVGMLAYLIDKPFGLWIMFAACSMRVYEEFTYQQMQKAIWDNYDAEIAAAAMEALRNGEVSAAPKMQSDPGSIGRSSGAGEDIREQLAKLRAEQEARAHARQQTDAEMMGHAREAAEAAKETAQAARETAQAVRDAADRAEQEGPTHTHTHTQETLIINNTEKETVRETVIWATEGIEREVVIVHTGYGEDDRRVLPWPIPDGMTEREWLGVHHLIDGTTIYPKEQEAEILAAHDQRRLTGKTAPIRLKPYVMPALPPPGEYNDERRLYVLPTDEDKSDDAV